MYGLSFLTSFTFHLEILSDFVPSDDDLWDIFRNLFNFFKPKFMALLFTVDALYNEAL